VIAVILLSTYLLIISVSLFPEHNAARIIDAILRLLFLPLIIAAALMIRRIRKEFGFDFLLSPFKLIIFSAGLVLVSIPLPFQILARKIYIARGHNALHKKETLESLRQERKKIIDAEKGASTIEQKLSLEKSRLARERQHIISSLKKQKKELRVWFESLRRGSDDAVFSELR